MPKRVMSAAERDRLGPSREHCVGCGEAAARVSKAEQAQAEQAEADLALANSEETIVKVAVSRRAQFRLAGAKAEEEPVAGENEKGGSK